MPSSRRACICVHRFAAVILAVGMVAGGGRLRGQGDEPAPILRGDNAGEPRERFRQLVILRVDVDGTATDILLQVDRPADGKGAGTRRFLISETVVYGAVFGRASTGETVRAEMQSLLKGRIEEIAGACDLSDEQKKKLRLAGEGDIRRIEGEIDALRLMLREPLPGADLGPEAQNQAVQLVRRIKDKAAPLRARVAAGLFDDDSLFQKILERSLTPEQTARLRRATLVRRALQLPAENPGVQFAAEDVGILIHALDNADREISLRAATWLVEVGRPALEPLLAALKSPSVRQRANVANVLRGMRHPGVVGPLARLLYDGDQLVRDCAGNALKDLAHDNPGGSLWQAESDPSDPLTAGKSSAQISETLRKAVLEEFGTALLSENDRARLAAAQYAYSLYAPELIGPLAACLRSDDVPLRKQAVTTLTVIRHPDALVQLLTGLRDDQVEIREIAADGLRYQSHGGSLRDERLLAPLIAALEDKSDKVRGQAALALGWIRAPGYERSLPHLIRLTTSESAVVAQAAIEALGALGDRRAADRLLELCGHPEHRAYAAVALANLDDIRAAATLRTLAREQDKDRKDHNVIAALGRLRDREAVPLLIELLGDETIRGTAANALGTIGDPRAVEPLIGLLTAEGNTATAAAQALGRIKDRRAVEPILDACPRKADLNQGGIRIWPNDLTENPVHNQFAWALFDMRYVAVEPLAQALADPSERVRRVAAWVLYNLAIQSGLDREDMQPAVEPLVRALDDPAEIVRFHAAMALGILREPRAVPTLLQALARSDEQSYHYGNSAAYLMQMADPSSVGPLIELLGHESPTVRMNAARALGRLRDPRVVEALTPRLKDADPSVRAAAVRTLGILQAQVPLESLLALLGDDHANVRESAADALGRLGKPQAADELAKLAGDAEPHVRVAAAVALVRMNDPRGVAMIKASLADPSDKVRERAAIAVLFASLSSESLAPCLIPSLADVSPTVRLYAADSLGKIGSRPALDALIEKLPDREILISVLGAISRIRDPRSFEALVRHLDDADPNVRKAAAHGLGQLGDAAGVAPLIARLSDDAVEVRTAAILALTRLKASESVAPLTTAAAHDDHPAVRTVAERALRRIKP